MEKLNELKQGLEDTWHSLSEGWRQLRERTSGTLTRFTPSNDKTPEQSADFPSANWALLAGDVFEDDDKFTVRLEVPGLDKNQLDIEVRNDMLIVRGEKRSEQETSNGQYRVRQCAFGSFHRSIPLPLPVLADKASASYRHGVLRIELPKAERTSGRRIEVHGE
nr:Hsp20/alpha crystallin family protein [uncultured Pseudomonas sp.]